MRMGMHYGSRTADRLTDRQREILALIAHGCTNGQIAERLGITLDGAKWHVSEIMAKLGASSREEAVAAWQAERAPRARIARAARWAGATLFTNQAAGIIAGVTVAAVVIAAVVVMVAASNGGNDSNPAAVTSPTPGTTSTPATSATAAASPSNTAAAVPSPAVTIPGPLVPPASLTKLEMLDSDNGWAFDTGSALQMVLRTANGGRTWHDVSPLQAQPKSIHQAFFLDRDHAWVLVVTEASGTAEAQPWIFRTSDGGATWQASDPFPGAIPQGALSFADPSNGWYFESQGAGAGSQGIAIYRTTDGGATWAKIGETSGGVGSPGPNLPLSCIKSQPLQLTATTGFATGSCAGGPPFLYRTTDGGETWSLVALPDPADASKTLTACSCSTGTPIFPTKSDGFLTMSGRHQAIYATHDAGATWKLTGPLPGDVSSTVAFADATHGWIIEGSHLFATTDAGAIWKDLGQPPFGNAILSFVSPTEGFAWIRVSADGNPQTGLLHTTDGGKTWVPVR
ncbi:MAG: LuxR C-terminal-related transcriptional regulator [Dehalococcoidia bacterium]|nr:LuxR C-terminal-related transcriptional regulator [Dehalococcoidia bacterium]